MGIDQCHEQLNTIVKGDGGALGITEDEEKFRKWMVCGPEIAKMVKEFEHVTILRMRTHNFAIIRTLQGFKGGSTIIIQVWSRFCVCNRMQPVCHNTSMFIQFCDVKKQK